jgi:hypothetical protein
MADVVASAYAVIFVSILLVVGVVVFGTIADPMGDQWYNNETVIAAGCSDDNASTESTLCSGTVDNIPIENVTRAVPVLYNCTTARTSCQLMTAGTHYNYSTTDGVIWLASGFNTTIGDTYNGTIFVSYWQDTALAGADNAQQSITDITYSGFDLAMVMVIVIAAVAIIGGVFLIGKRGA